MEYDRSNLTQRLSITVAKPLIPTVGSLHPFPASNLGTFLQMSSSSLPLIIAQFAISGHPRRTEHWALVALWSKNNGRVFQIVGNTDSFTYDAGDVDEFSASSTFCGGCLVGYVEANSLHRLDEKLKDIQIIRGDPSFDCQTWAISALETIDGDGIQITERREQPIRTELMLDKARWDVAEDTVEERLFP
jgi:hypothetical protein